MKQNKRRTLVTIIGVIISVAMITAVMTLGISFQDLLKRQTIAQEGLWHVLYEDVTPDQAKAIGEDTNTETLMLWQEQGFALLEDMGMEYSPYKPYIAVSAYDANGYKNYPITLLNGRMPQNGNEVVISKQFLNDVKGANIAVGDEIELSLGTRYLEDGVYPDSEKRSDFKQNDYARSMGNQLDEKLKDIKKTTYLVVGEIEQPAWERSWYPSFVFYTFLDNDALQQAEKLNASIVAAEVSNDIYPNSEKFKESFGINVTVNNELLRYDYVSWHGGFLTTMYSLTVIIMGIVIVGSVSLIYNAFGISVADRSRYLGMLASVGATRRQKRNSVFFEGAVIGLISIPLGMLGGLAGLAITFWAINSMVQGLFSISETLIVKVTPLTMLVSIVISLITIFISTWLPARRAAKVSPIDAIRQSQDVKLSKRKVKNNRLVRKLFGIEADIALKNLKRNKRRYQITVFSLIISIILFLSVSFFTNVMTKSIDMSNSGINYDIEVGSYEQASFQPIIDLELVSSYNELSSFTAKTTIDESQLPPGIVQLVEQDQLTVQNGKLDYYLQIYGMSNEAFAQFSKDQGIDANEYMDSSNIKALLINSINYYSFAAQKKIEEAPLLNAKGMNLELTVPISYRVEKEDGQYEYKERQVELPEVNIGELVNAYPMGIIKGDSSPASMILVVPMDSLNKLASADEEIGKYTSVYLTSKDPMKLMQDIHNLNNLDDMYVSNIYEARQQEEQMVVLISVFTYGFIALITLISIANILNTISTGIQLRRREFAMLRSMGMTKQGFNRMINYESIFYGMKSLLYGLPISGVVMYLIHRSMMNSMDYKFEVPWISIIIAIVSVFVIVSISMIYSGSKVKKGSIVDAIKQENI